MKTPALLLLLGAGCASTPLLADGDPTFERAQSRLRRSLERSIEPRESGTPLPDDETLFVQAEAIYQYRFSLRQPGAGAYAAQAAAAATDFAPLNVLAASSGMNELRLEAYNGAAQLYEALVDRHQASRLRPLALYRLGWTYRSTSVGGFPRDSARAFEAVVQENPGSDLAALAQEANQVPFKTQGKAIAWSLLPGAGQMYVGRWGSGALRLTIATGFAAATVIPIVFMAKNDELDWKGALISLAGLIGLQVTYTTSYQDAQKAALEFNEQRQAEFEERHLDAP